MSIDTWPPEKRRRGFSPGKNGRFSVVFVVVETPLQRREVVLS